VGATSVPRFALVAARHMARFGTKPEQLARVAATIRNHGHVNPEAVMFGKGSLLPAFAGVQHQLPDLECVVVATDGPFPQLRQPTVSLAEFLDGAEPAECCAAPRVSDVQGIVYTSGTTGVSKGVVVHWGRHQEGVRMFLDWVTPDDAWFSMFPACHNSAKIWMRLVPFIGCRAVLSPAFKTRTFFAEATRAEATVTLLLPNMVHWLLMTDPSPATGGIRCVRWWVTVSSCCASRVLPALPHRHRLPAAHLPAR
jgi:acyl-CoA synthetase (AMP-forming)/AMP-acid ligase II